MAVNRKKERMLIFEAIQKGIPRSLISDIISDVVSIKDDDAPYYIRLRVGARIRFNVPYHIQNGFYMLIPRYENKGVRSKMYVHLV